MKQFREILAPRPNDRRGVVLIAVLAILAILTLVGATMALSTRLEIRAANNFANGVQANMAAVTGVTAALDTIETMDGAVAFNQRWARPELTPAELGEGKGATASSASRDLVEVYNARKTFPTDEADVYLQDESGRLNVNAVGRLRNQTVAEDELIIAPCDLDLAAALGAILRAAGASDAEAGSLAHAIIDHRYGPDGQPGLAGVDDNLNSGSAGVNPTSDNVDNDRDGIVDNEEERFYSVLSNGIDDDSDGEIDDDTEGLEHNGRDDDGDGQIDEAGEGVDEPAEFISDPREVPYGDDRPYRRLEDLLDVPGMTPELLAALRNYITVFSCAEGDYLCPRLALGEEGDGFGEGRRDDRNGQRAGRTDEEHDSGKKGQQGKKKNGGRRGEGRHKPSLNTASAHEIEEELLRAYPDWSPQLALQFAANIVDARDSDSVPTVLTNADGLSARGVEITPYINEICADSPTDEEDGDDGQYVELHNPYSVRLSVEGWRLVVGRQRLRLRGDMAPGSYLVITDDYNGKNDPGGEERPGYGSFYDIFGQVPSGSNARLIEIRTLNLPNNVGQVSLIDKEGELIDLFEYKGAGFDGTRKSHQRNDPRIPIALRASATPLRRNADYNPPVDRPVDALFADPDTHDRAFASVGEILTLYAGYVNVASRELNSWRWPQLRAEGDDAPDIRLLDLFTVRPDELFDAPTLASEELPADSTTLNIARLQRDAAQWAEGIEYGKLNVNTASAAVLAALPVELPEGDPLPLRIAARRDELGRQLAAERRATAAPFPNLSDFFLDDEIFGDLEDEQRLALAARIVGALTTNSRSFTVYSHGEASVGTGQAQASRDVLATICRTETAARVISWHYAYTNSRRRP